MARILDGKAVAAAVYEDLKRKVGALPVVPKIVFVRVGEDPASRTYVNSKAKKSQELGLLSETVVLPESVTEAELIQWIDRLNKTASVHGILVQLPLPRHLDKARVLDRIDPKKDVDGLHANNAGRLLQGSPRFVPCTPAGIIQILDHYQIPISGKRAVVVGRSEIVGKPVGLLLLQRDATVTICHSRTADLPGVVSQADIVVAAVGRPKFLGANHIKAGATVIDVGINRTESGLVGDVDFAAVEPKAGAITPVPGGVGPMTICMLMRNLIEAARHS
jgi:methylenetetrahydrofolate dehydrogenase (NADP+) / methenyltetrahydrofolate cyclohydrolase